jgi:hypothetical protein
MKFFWLPSPFCARIAVIMSLRFFWKIYVDAEPIMLLSGFTRRWDPSEDMDDIVRGRSHASTPRARLLQRRRTAADGESRGGRAYATIRLDRESRPVSRGRRPPTIDRTRPRLSFAHSR